MYCVCMTYHMFYIYIYIYIYIHIHIHLHDRPSESDHAAGGRGGGRAQTTWVADEWGEHQHMLFSNIKQKKRKKANMYIIQTYILLFGTVVCNLFGFADRWGQL